MGGRSVGLQFGVLCVEGWHAEWDAGPDEGEIGSDGVRIGRARCLEACLGVTAGVIAEAKRCYSCESLHETTNPVAENQDKQGEEVYYS